MADEQFIRNQIRRILFEETEGTTGQVPTPTPALAESAPQDSEEDKRTGKVAKVKPGRGRVKAEIEEAGALANSDPQELMKKLKIKAAPGDSSIKQIAFILNKAVETLKSVPGLEEAYERIAIKKSPEGDLYIHIIPNKISARDALLYMNHTIVGAVNAGVLKNLDQEVVPELKKGRALINFTDL